MRRKILVLALPCLMLVAAVYAADVKLDGVKCVVAGGKAAQADKSVDYKGAKVYFCCAGCPKAFQADTTKFATKANFQLVATGQAKQEKCPLSGKPVAADKTVDVAGVKVGFCCDGCKGKIAAAGAGEQLELCFANKAFDANYKVGK